MKRKDEHPTSNAQHRTPNKKNRAESPRERRREMSPETRELVAAYAKVMGWPVERVLPHANDMEVSHHV